MFGFLGKLLGSEKALNTVVGGASRAIDALVYTDEEKAQAAAKDRSEARAMVVRWMEATQGQNLARRLIALLVTAVWLTQYLLTMSLSVAAVWLSDPDTAARVIASADLIGSYAERMNGAMMLILGFYFAAPHMSAITGKALEKFGRSNPAGRVDSPASVPAGRERLRKAMQS